MVFVKRKLNRHQLTLGEQLHAARRHKAASLDIAERQTQIQKRYLVALERGEYTQLPEPLYTRRFLRLYASYLELDPEYMLALYEQECGCCDLVLPSITPIQRLRSWKLFAWNKFVYFFGILCVLAGAGVYFGSQVSNITAPPEIVLFSPGDQIITNQSTVTVAGYVHEEVEVYIDNELVILDETNSFSKNIQLQKGVNEIHIEGKKRYSRKQEISRIVVFDEDSVVINN